MTTLLHFHVLHVVHPLAWGHLFLGIWLMGGNNFYALLLLLLLELLIHLLIWLSILIICLLILLCRLLLIWINRLHIRLHILWLLNHLLLPNKALVTIKLHVLWLSLHIHIHALLLHHHIWLHLTNHDRHRLNKPHLRIIVEDDLNPMKFWCNWPMNSSCMPFLIVLCLQ